MSYKTFIESLELDDNGNLPVHVQEEYLQFSSGMLDGRYIGFIQEEKLTDPKFRAIVNEELGKITFEKQENINEVTEEAFFKDYSFGTYINVRSWIGYFHRVHNLVLTREALFGYLTTGA